MIPTYGIHRNGTRRYKNVRILLLFLICIFAVLFGMASCRIGEGIAAFWTRESKYDGLIVEAARRNRIDPYLVKALIWRESRFNRNARGLKGEIGLMQVMHAFAAVDWAREKGVPVPSKGAISDPSMNIEIGSWFLARALRRWQKYKDQTELGLCEYNAGLRRAMEWRPKDPQDPVSGRITIPSTKSYVRDIVKRAAYYRKKQALRQPTEKKR